MGFLMVWHGHCSLESQKEKPKFPGRADMQRLWFSGLTVTLALFLGVSSLYAQPRGRGGMGQGYGMGNGMMGHGRMMGRGGMMHPGWGTGSGSGPLYRPQYGPQGSPQNTPQYHKRLGPMEEGEAQKILQNYLKSSRNPNLTLGKLEDKGQTFQADILTGDKALVDRIVVDKNTGWIRSIYSQ